VELDVVIEPTGRVSRVSVLSGDDPALDRAAVEAVGRLGPVPLPDHLPKRQLRVILPLSFELR
jgi:TonB family protein